jgi:cardiolipin synthase
VTPAVTLRYLPTLLSLSRAMATPIIVLAVMRGERNWAFQLCCAAGFTDFLDGFIARRFGWTSRLGAWMDAICDKILLSSLYVAFGIAGWAPAWLVWLVLGRDLLILTMALLGLAFTTIRDFPPSIWGKISTNIQIAAAAAILAGPAALFEPAVAVCAIATAWSGLHYIATAAARYRNYREGCSRA